MNNDFTVKAPIERVWAYLLDVEKIAPCAPGAELTEVIDERTWKGKMNVKVGPVSMSFAGTVLLQERDDAGHRAVLKAEGREQKGRGAASAVVTSWLEGVDDGTKVSIETDLTISGAAAQYGRGMIGDVSKRLTKEFAACLQASMGTPDTTAENHRDLANAPAEEMANSLPAAQASVSRRVAAKPVKGFRLAVWAVWRAVVRTFKRLLGREAA